jgi:FKBP-type peptidyl-prolyl cis-trans isomerase SlyD
MTVERMERIADGMVVSLAYTMTVEGEVIEESTADEPLDYLHGAQNIVLGLENALTGKAVGERVSVTLQPEDAYGEYDPEDIDEIDRSDIPDGEQIEPGMVLLLEDEEGYMFEATVAEVTARSVMLDFNDPLAGKVVTYDVEVLAVRPADEEELAHGHPHGEEGHEDDWDEE